MTPIVSIIIPFYNAEGVIARSVACALGQTEQDVEVVCVDDGSTDGGAQVVRQLAQDDARVRLASHGQNRGRLQARLTGIDQAVGSFVMFLDADDELASDAVTVALEHQRQETAAGEGEHDGFDIVQFAFEMRYAHFATDEQKEFDAEFNRPPAEKAYGDDVVHVVYRDRKTTWSLCGKLMRAQLVKAAAQWAQQAGIVHLQAAEDAFLYFLIACQARSYCGLPKYEGYVYNIDIGGSNALATRMDAGQFERTCQYADAMAGIARYVEETGRSGLAGDVDVVRYEHLIAVADKLIRHVMPADKAQAFATMAAKWTVPDAVAGLADAGWMDPAGTLGDLAQAGTLRCSPRQVRTIAAYHHVMTHGGAERVTAEMAALWRQMGYNVVLLCDAERSECAYPVPDDVAWVRLPAAADVQRNTYLGRARAFAAALAEHNVDVLVHHQWWSPLLAWDMMLAKACNVPVCMYMHNIYTVIFREGRPLEYDCARVFRHADALVVLSEADRRFWSQFNPCVWVTNNPPTLRTADIAPASLAGANVVWVGRLTPWDKQPEQAIRIFARVHDVRSDATLTLVGPAPDKSELARLKKLASNLGVGKAVEFAGSASDVRPFLSRASVHLLTSAYDGWCLALAESKAAGVPCVMYEMPYLTLAQGERGLAAVPQGDADAAAERVLALLADEGYRRGMGAQARSHAQELESFGYRALWQRVFGQLGQGSPARGGFQDLDTQWDMLLDVQKSALEAARGDAVRDIEGSYTYKAGKAIMALPKFLRKRMKASR